MSVLFSIALAAIATLTPGEELKRQERDDTIYVLRGDRGALQAFREQIGDEWTGGILVEDRSAAGVLRYWAYSVRSASESRSFMMPAIFSGIDLAIEGYDEAKSFPAERGKLDQVALKCGSAVDPFFITPLRSLEIDLPANVEPALQRCLLEGARGVDQEMTIRTPRKGKEEE